MLEFGNTPLKGGFSLDETEYETFGILPKTLFAQANMRLKSTCD
jgi:hypothetical protein